MISSRYNGALALIATAFENPEVEAVFSDLDYVSQADTSRVIRHWSTGPFRPRRLKFGWMPAHPTLYLRREVYEHFGVYDINLRIAADYDFILRYFSQATGKSVYIPEVLYKMRLGGVSNRNWAKIRQKMDEDLFAIRRNHVEAFTRWRLKTSPKSASSSSDHSVVTSLSGRWTRPSPRQSDWPSRSNFGLTSVWR